MSIRSSFFVAWLGAAAVVGLAAAAAVSSPRVRYQLASAGQLLAELADRGVKALRTRMQTGFGRQMAVLQEVSETLDAATTQWEASMTVSKVAAALADEPRLRGCTVGVRMIGGILHLEGDVRSEEEKRLAGQIAREVSGAELVANDLKVATPVS